MCEISTSLAESADDLVKLVMEKGPSHGRPFHKIREREVIYTNNDRNVLHLVSEREPIMMSEMRGKAWGVLGPIDPSQLGLTLTHEHLLCDASIYFQPPEEASQRRFAQAPVSLETLGWIRLHPYLNLDNLRLDDEEMMAEEALRFRDAGGRTIVDATSVGIGRDPDALRRISLRTGLNLIAGSGYYIALTHPRDIRSKTVDDIKIEIVKDISVGIQNSGVRAGIIGEIGTTFPWGPNEEKVLRAAGRAQRETGAPVEVHPGRNRQHPAMILDILEKEGADLKRVVICHVERTLGSMADFRSVLDRGAFVEFDNFGQSWFAFPGHKLDWPFPSDSARVFRIRELIDAGYADRILVSLDIDSKILLYRYGGHGFAHIPLTISALMQSLIPPEDVDRILVDNPRRLLTFTQEGSGGPLLSALRDSKGAVARKRMTEQAIAPQHVSRPFSPSLQKAYMPRRCLCYEKNHDIVERLFCNHRDQSLTLVLRQRSVSFQSDNQS